MFSEVHIKLYEESVQELWTKHNPKTGHEQRTHTHTPQCIQNSLAFKNIFTIRKKNYTIY